MPYMEKLTKKKLLNSAIYKFSTVKNLHVWVQIMSLIYNEFFILFYFIFFSIMNSYELDSNISHAKLNWGRITNGQFKERI